MNTIKKRLNSYLKYKNVTPETKITFDLLVELMEGFSKQPRLPADDWFVGTKSETYDQTVEAIIGLVIQSNGNSCIEIYCNRTTGRSYYFNIKEEEMRNMAKNERIGIEREDISEEDYKSEE